MARRSTVKSFHRLSSTSSRRRERSSSCCKGANSIIAGVSATRKRRLHQLKAQRCQWAPHRAEWPHLVASLARQPSEVMPISLRFLSPSAPSDGSAKLNPGLRQVSASINAARMRELRAQGRVRPRNAKARSVWQASVGCWKRIQSKTGKGISGPRPSGVEQQAKPWPRSPRVTRSA